MEYTFHRNGDVGVLHLQGRLTADRMTKIREAFLVSIENSDHVVVNCSDVTEIDNAGLQMFCSAYRISARANKRLSIVCMSPGVFSITPYNISSLCSSRTVYGCSGSCLWSSRGLPLTNETCI